MDVEPDTKISSREMVSREGAGRAAAAI